MSVATKVLEKASPRLLCSLNWISAVPGTVAGARTGVVRENNLIYLVMDEAKCGCRSV